MKRIILDNGDGTVSVLIPAPEYVAQLVGQIMPDGEVEITEELALVHIHARDGGGRPGVVVDSANIPQDRTFRNAWKPHTNGVEVDMPRACDIHMDKIRATRDKKFVDLDYEYIICDEQGDAPGKSAIAAQKQTLRDLPATFDLSGATTPEELKALWPSELS